MQEAGGDDPVPLAGVDTDQLTTGLLTEGEQPAVDAQALAAPLDAEADDEDGHVHGDQGEGDDRATGRPEQVLGGDDLLLARLGVLGAVEADGRLDHALGADRSVAALAAHRRPPVGVAVTGGVGAHRGDATGAPRPRTAPGPGGNVHRSWPRPVNDELEAELEHLARTPQLLVACDYDGTVAPIVDDPMAGHPATRHGGRPPGPGRPAQHPRGDHLRAVPAGPGRPLPPAHRDPPRRQPRRRVRPRLRQAPLPA